MNVVEAVMLTPEGWRQLHDELALLQERRADVAEEPLDDAGARPELAALEARIDELHRVLQRAVPVDRAELLPDTVGVGSNVTVRWGDGDEETYTLVGPPEIEPRSGKISYESPVGQALIGRRSGEQVTVSTLEGVTLLEIVTVGHGADAG
jgi:transcription elongation factor GreA